MNEFNLSKTASTKTARTCFYLATQNSARRATSPPQDAILPHTEATVITNAPQVVRCNATLYSLPNPTLTEAIGILDQSVPDPRNGLPEDLFLLVSRLTPLVNVDLLIQDQQQRTLLTWRDDSNYTPGWHIPGGIIRYKETAFQRIREVARTELGASVEFDPTPVTFIESIAPERNRGHFISLLYRCRLSSEPDPQREALTEPPRPGDWRWHSRPPDDLLDVHDVYRRFLQPDARLGY